MMYGNKFPASIALLCRQEIFKTLMRKASVGKRDIHLSILEWRNTPSSGMQASPVQRLMSRRTRTLIPTIQSEFRPRVQRNVPEKLMQKREHAKHYYDRNAKELPEIESGDSIRMRTADGLKASNVGSRAVCQTSCSSIVYSEGKWSIVSKESSAHQKNPGV